MKFTGMSQDHVGWIDAYKGVLIVLVVLGHVIGGEVHLIPEGMLTRTVAEFLFKFIYSFHMPAFFFIALFVYTNSISGWSLLFSKRRDR